MTMTIVDRHTHTHHRPGGQGITHTHPHHGQAHRHEVADLIPAAPAVGFARGAYADGYRSAVAAMRILAPGLTREQMRAHVVRNIIPVHAGTKTDYEHGQSDAFAAYQSNDRRSP